MVSEMGKADVVKMDRPNHGKYNRKKFVRVHKKQILLELIKLMIRNKNLSIN